MDDPLWTGFATRATYDEVRRAVATARRRLDVAKNAQYLVLLQAIHALSTQGHSTREIAGVVGISKSAVNRHLRHGIEGVAVHRSSEISANIRQAWRGLARPQPLSEVEEQAQHRRVHPVVDELQRAIEAEEQPGQNWPYRLNVYKFKGDWATRDSLAHALENSAWMAASIDLAGAPESSTLWHLWHNLRQASTIPEYDQIVRAIYELAEQDRCWIEFVQPTEG